MNFLSDISDCLADADAALLLLINSRHSPALDAVMWAASDRWIWVPLYMSLAWLLVRRSGPAAAAAALVLIGGLIAASDQTCASLIRPVVGRLRPSNPDSPLSAALHLVGGYRGGAFGFPSCHAANTMALAVFLALVFRNKRFSTAMIGWSSLVSYSRVYLGVHYPSDILAGMAVGSALACIFYMAFRIISHRLPAASVRRFRHPCPSRRPVS